MILENTDLTSPPDGYESDNTLATSTYLFDHTGHQVTPSVVGQPVEKGNAERNGERRAAKLARELKRRDRILDYWNIDNFEHAPVALNSRKSDGPMKKETIDRLFELRAKVHEEYGFEMLQAAKEGEGLGEEGRVIVWDRNMPEAMKDRLGVE